MNGLVVIDRPNKKRSCLEQVCAAILCPSRACRIESTTLSKCYRDLIFANLSVFVSFEDQILSKSYKWWFLKWLGGCPRRLDQIIWRIKHQLFCGLWWHFWVHLCWLLWKLVKNARNENVHNTKIRHSNARNVVRCSGARVFYKSDRDRRAAVGGQVV